MEAVAEALASVQSVTDDASALEHAQRAWERMFPKLVSPCAWEEAAFDAAFDALMAHRLKRAQVKLGDDALTCTFLVECLARLLIVDCFSVSADTATRDAFYRRRDDWMEAQGRSSRHTYAPLNDFEVSALQSEFREPRSLEDFAETFDDALDAWREAPLEARRATLWVEAAYAVVFLRPAGQFTDADRFMLFKLATMSTESAMRVCAVAKLRRGATLDPSVPAWNHEWLTAKTRFAGEEMSNAARRAVLATRVPSYVMRADAAAATKTEHELAAQWLTKYANSMKDETGGGPTAILARGGAPAQACMLAVWDYLVQQRLKFGFKKLFWASDQNPLAMNLRIERYVNDSIVDPPPLLVTAWDGAYLLCRHRTSPTLEFKARYKTVGDAIDKWCRLVIERRRGAVFTNANVEALYHELFDVRAAEEQAVVLHTKTLDMV